MNQSKALEETLKLYKETGIKSLFSKIRFWDAPYLEVEKIVPKAGKIVDIGCGEGLFSNFLGLMSGGRKVLGVEINRNRLKIADRGVKNVGFEWGDATKFKFKNADCVVLFHLLHHISSFKDQEKTLGLCYDGLKKRGRLIVVEVDVKPTFKYFLSWATDHFLVPMLFEKRLYSPIYFRKRQEWIKLLKSYGFDVSWKLAEKGKPFSHIVFVCEKK